MKKLFFASLALFLVACGTRQSFIGIDPYTPTASSQVQNRSVIIANVSDQRAKKDVIAMIKDSKGNISEYVVSNTDIAGYFKTALVTELASRGVGVNGEGSDIVNVAINELNANLSGYEKDNMQANIKVTLTIQKDSGLITKNYADKQTKFQLIPTGSAFSPLIKSALDDMVKRVADGILQN
ncbi:MAG: hypothetical protein K5978_07225 [Campylobacter sp.]|nr:hypothetical protein [Campylobacter sp.]